MPLIHLQCTILDNIDFGGAGNRVFITKCPNSFVQDCSTKWCPSYYCTFFWLALHYPDESIEAWNSYDHYFKIGQVLYEQQWPYLFQQNDSTWRQLANQYLHCCLSLSQWKFQLDDYSKELWCRTLLWNTVYTLQLPYIGSWGGHLTFSRFKIQFREKSILQVPDTGTSQYWWILEHFWCTSIAWKCDIYVL